MPFLELSLVIQPEQQASAEEALTASGALSLTLRDANAETPDEQAIFEPGVGELPAWESSVLSALFPAQTGRGTLALALGRALPWLDRSQLQFSEVADQDWERAWMDQFRPMSFGRRLWIYPWNIEPPTADETRSDDGHADTPVVDGLDLAARSIVDYGCGSGVLAIAALKLGAADAQGIDNDPQALLASVDNARRNAVAGRLRLRLAADGQCEPADVLVANILAGPLAALAPTFAEACRPGAEFAISGILQGQEAELLERYATWFDGLQATTRDGWVRISGHRRR